MNRVFRFAPNGTFIDVFVPQYFPSGYNRYEAVGHMEWRDNVLWGTGWYVNMVRRYDLSKNQLSPDFTGQYNYPRYSISDYLNFD
jgi:hypothetical protein